jgi:hypothetical protein
MKQSERAVLRRWTRHEYERLIDHGFLDEDDPIELLDGLLLVKEPQHSLHRTAVLLVAKAVERAFGGDWFVHTQSPMLRHKEGTVVQPARTISAANASSASQSYGPSRNAMLSRVQPSARNWSTIACASFTVPLR